MSVSKKVEQNLYFRMEIQNSSTDKASVEVSMQQPSLSLVDSQRATKQNITSECLFTKNYGLFQHCNADKCLHVEFDMKRTMVRNRTIFRMYRTVHASFVDLDEFTACARNKVCRKKIIKEKKPLQDEVSEWQCIPIAKGDERTWLIEYPDEWEDYCGRISKCILTTYDDEEEQNATDKFLNEFNGCNESKSCAGYNKYFVKIKFNRCAKKFGRGRLCKNFPFGIRICQNCTNYVGLEARNQKRNEVCGSNYINGMYTNGTLYRKDKSTGGCVIYRLLKPELTEVLPDGSICMFEDSDSVQHNGMCIMGFCYPRNEAAEYKTNKECEMFI